MFWSLNRFKLRNALLCFLQVNSSKQTGAGTNEVYVPTLWYYDALNFLGLRSEPCRITPESIEDEEVNSIIPIYYTNFEIANKKQLFQGKNQNLRLITRNVPMEQLFIFRDFEVLVS